MPDPIEYATPQPVRRPSPAAFWLLYAVGGVVVGYILDEYLHYLWGKPSDRGGLFIAYVALAVVAVPLGLGVAISGKRFLPLVGLAVGVLVPPVVFGILLAL